MTNLLMAAGSFSNVFSLLTADSNTEDLTRILGFDLQTLIQIGFQAAAVLLLFYMLGRLLFNPVREILSIRKEKIESTLDEIEDNEKETLRLKEEYEDKIKNIKNEADKILAHAHTRAVAREDEIVREANEEANKIMQRAHLEVEREREQLKDDVRKEIIHVATVMAEKFVEVSLSEEQQKLLVSETINEMGDNTWLN